MCVYMWCVYICGVYECVYISTQRHIYVITCYNIYVRERKTEKKQEERERGR